MSDGIDLTRHGILEAHAGTGKTYTIVAMVLRLLESERLELRRILLVTFTQKAAGELLERIRDGIAERARETPDPEIAAHLRNCLGQLGDCWIGTIHGVALRILRNWPFESGLPFQTELVDDADGLDRAVREVWRGNPWGLSPEDLALLGEGKPVSALVDRVLELASGRLDPDMVLLPEETVEIPAWREESARTQQALRVLEQELREADSTFLPWLRGRHETLVAMDRTGFSKSFDGALANALKRWEMLLRAGTSRKSTDARGSSSAKSVADLLGKKDRALPEALRAERVLEEVVARWSDAYGSRLGDRETLLAETTRQVAAMRARLLADWARRTAVIWKDRKAREGLLSYQDMLEKLREALRQDTFRAELRKRIAVGIIDEFQDTSALQWDIFRLWFLEGVSTPAPRLFLVGDPKQSIYSFQGGDVRTYLKARNELVAAGAAVHPLRSNWRSTPELLEGVNSLLTCRPWFGETISYTASEQVSPPLRTDPTPLQPRAFQTPVRVVRLEGSAGARRSRYADLVAGSILAWLGQTVSVPKGGVWESRTLDWGDFAVLVQTRTSVPAFRRAFRRAGIPWALYKEQGVFASRAARELRTVLAALVEPPSRNSMKLRALLTRFFGVRLDTLDPATHLAPGHPASSFLERLSGLASAGRWAQLAQALRRDSGVETRLLAEPDGDRQWMDLHQVLDHCLEFLVVGSGGLPEVVEHLDRLARGEIRATEDRNLHARSTDRQRVQILTMHVSKGLEFPIVFLAPSGKPVSRGEPRWIAPHQERLRLHVAAKEVADPVLPKAQADEELSRLLYVALTRPKLLAVLPLHLDAKGQKPQDKLSEILLDLGQDLPASFGWMDPLAIADSGRDLSESVKTGADAGLRIDPARIANLALASRTQALSSYSAISRAQAAPGPEGRWARAEEHEHVPALDPTNSVPATSVEPPDAWLPRGATTGDAVHELLEALLGFPDLSWARGQDLPGWVGDLATRCLRVHGLPAGLNERLGRLAMRLLGSPMPVAGCASPVRLCDLPLHDRKPEVEFHCALDGRGNLVLSGEHLDDAARPGWLVGYIDLLFRHEGAWHVLDWKTTTLPTYEPSALEEGMLEHDYRLQASLYTHVAGQGRIEAGGGAVYVFLRAVAGDLDGRDLLPGIWTATPCPEDATSTRDRIGAWLASRNMAIPRGESS